MLKHIQKSWSEYWLSGYLDSFGNNQLINDDLLFLSWQARLINFLDVDNPISILDIGCGNGYITNVIKDLAMNNNLPKHKVSNIDIANISPAEDPFFTKLKIDYYSETDLEEWEVINDKFDLIISNFCLEYLDMNKALVRISNDFLADNGFFCLLVGLKSDDSTKQLTQFIRDGNIALTSNLFDNTIAYLKAEGLKSSSEVKASREKMSRSYLKVREAAEKNKSMLLFNTIQAMDVYFSQIEQVGLKLTIERILNAKESTKLAVDRYRTIKQSLVDVSQIKNIEKTFFDNGFKVIKSRKFGGNDGNKFWEVETIKI